MPVRPSPDKAASIPHAVAKPLPKPTAREFARSAAFRAVCEARDIKPTERQARAYLAGRGRWAAGKAVAS